MSAQPQPLDTRTPWRGDSELLRRVEACMADLIEGSGDPCGAMAAEHMLTGGKRLRARLALEAVRALGGDPHRAVPWAAACELIHNASLVHDDLQDGDKMRRGRPALWAVHGAHQAISVGDLLLMLPTVALSRMDADDTTRWNLARSIAHHGANTARGQSAELAMRDGARVDVRAYRHAAVGKTAGLFGMPVEGAALLIGRSSAECARLAAPFCDLGLLYQLQDDVIDLYGDKGREDVGADIREGKVSALVVAHLERHPEDRLWLSGVLRAPRESTTREQVSAVMLRFAEGGALADVLSWIDELARSVDGPELAEEQALRAVALHLRARFLEPLKGVKP